jgi:D-aminoacyl-tRNA deacylase
MYRQKMLIYMNILLICSKTDLAAVNFFETLTTESFGFKKLLENLWFLNKKNKIYLTLTEKTHLYMSDKDISKIEKEADTEFEKIIFLSRHSTLGENKPRSITAHSVGNWGKAELGGIDETLVKTDAILIRALLLNLYLKKPRALEYEVKQEATHHGPFLEKPTIFVEIGSNEMAWKDKVVCDFVSKELIKVISDYDYKETKDKNNWQEVVGVGGSHYCTKFNRFTFNLENKYCFGHIIPDYALKQITDTPKLKELLECAKEKSNSSLFLDENLKEITF